jgi:type II secretory pathway predicted ATPase ExeA
VVVTAKDIEQAEAIVDAAIASAEPYHVVRISAAVEGRSSRDVLALSIAALADEARDAGCSVVVVVSDADLASAEQLDRIRLDLEGARGGIDVVRMVLVGSPVLSRILALPSARAVATRVGMRAML